MVCSYFHFKVLSLNLQCEIFTDKACARLQQTQLSPSQLQTAGPSVQTGCRFIHGLSWAVTPAPSYDSSPRVLSMILSCPQNQSHMNDSYFTEFSCQPEVQPWPPLECSRCVNSQKTLPRRLNLNDAILFLITTTFSVLLTSNCYPEGFTLGVLTFCPSF